jgi:pseudouridine synthase
MLEDGKTKPAKVKQLKPNVIDITIHEGKNRIVRRMIKKLGYKLKTLERTQIGNLKLANLNPGQYRNLTEKEKKEIFT